MFLSSCREMTRTQLTEWDDEWLVTYDKVQKAVGLAKQLCVPVVGYLLLIPDRIVVVTRLINDRGEVVAPMRLDRTQTQATINGGQVVRTNAYIKITGAKELR